MRVVFDEDRCDLQGLCVSICPEVFGFDDDDQVRLLVAEPGEDLRAKVEEAVNRCPARAIELE